MPFKFPHFRFPTWAEVKALFLKTTHVSQIVAGVEAQVRSLEVCAEHQVSLAATKIEEAFGHQTKANAAQAAAATATLEADKAKRVSANLSGLIA